MQSLTRFSVAEVLALSDNELLVLERGFVGGQGNTIRIFRLSLAGLPEVSDVASLASLSQAEHESALASKTLLLDLVDCPDSGAMPRPDAVQPNGLFDNFEAMALGPVLPGGWQSLVLVSDNNTNPQFQITRVIALALPQSEIVGLTPDLPAAD